MKNWLRIFFSRFSGHGVARSRQLLEQSSSGSSHRKYDSFESKVPTQSSLFQGKLPKRKKKKKGKKTPKPHTICEPNTLFSSKRLKIWHCVCPFYQHLFSLSSRLMTPIHIVKMIANIPCAAKLRFLSFISTFVGFATRSDKIVWPKAPRNREKESRMPISSFTFRPCRPKGAKKAWRWPMPHIVNRSRLWTGSYITYIIHM